MASVKNNPYGSNSNYETVTKIIGSKYIQCRVEKKIGKAKEDVKAEIQSMLQTLPPCNTRQTRGNALGLSKPPCQQINYALNDEQQNKGEKEEHKSQQAEMNDSKSVGSKDLKPVNKHCVTAPSGDKSLSYIHTLKKPFVGPQTSGQLERQENIMEKSRDIYEENDSLLAILKKEQDPLSLTIIDKLQEECKVLDRRVSGFLSQAQLSHLLLKHEVPLQLPTVKLLFMKFSNANAQELVNYEKLLQFLRRGAASTTQQKQSLPEKTQYVKNQRRSSWTPEDALQTLKEMLKDHKGGMNLGKLRLDFMQQDKSSSGLLSLPELSLLLKDKAERDEKHELSKFGAEGQKHEILIEMICHMNGLPLYPGMLEVLAVTYDLNRRGRILWNTFVEFLKKVQVGRDYASLFSKRRNKEKDEDNQKGNKHHKDLSTKPWEQMNPDTSDSSDFEERDAWIDRFRKLEKALYLSDVKNTGKLEKEKAKRLIHNYNQIYDLCLSPLKIDKAFRPFRHGQDMPLEPLLQYLKEL